MFGACLWGSKRSGLGTCRTHGDFDGYRFDSFTRTVKSEPHDLHVTFYFGKNAALDQLMVEFIDEGSEAFFDDLLECCDDQLPGTVSDIEIANQVLECVADDRCSDRVALIVEGEALKTRQTLVEAKHLIFMLCFETRHCCTGPQPLFEISVIDQR